jgi:glycosyltransferase involved in cell wall biosynthesis
MPKEADFPRFSVIIPVYNGVATIERAIESVLSQQWPAHEVIVVNDGSSDGTAAKIAQYRGKVICLSQRNAGVSAARNLGASAATGDWLAFLDADDWYYPERLRCHAEWIHRDPTMDFLTGDFDYVRPDGSVIRRSMESTALGRELLRKADPNGMIEMGRSDLGDFVERHFGDTHTLSLPRSTFLELDGYPREYQVCEDVFFLTRLCARSQRVGVVCQSLGAYVIHEGSATRGAPIRAQRQTVAALEQVMALIADESSIVRGGLERALRHARMDLAYVLLREKRRGAAVRAALPVLYQRPGWQSLRDIMSIIRGVR